MRNLFYFIVLLMFLCLTILSCDKAPDLLENPLVDEGYLSKSNKGKPPRDSSPEIVSLEIDDWRTEKNIPYDKVKVSYIVKNASQVDQIRIAFRYDLDGDGEYRTFFDPFVFYETIPGTGEDVIDDYFEWDGSVLPDFSSGPYLFDQLATTEADQYLLHFSVSGQNIWASNGQPDDDEKVKINASTKVDGFWVKSVEIISQNPSKKKAAKKFMAELTFRVTCSQPGFKGTGKWITYDGTIDCCPNFQFDSEGEYFAESNNPILVGPGTYYFYVRNVYSPDYSYDPSQNEGWLWPEEPYGRVEVE